MVVYPTNPEEWQEWIWKHLDITMQKAVELLKADLFPVDKLVDKWIQQFSVKKGYVADFIHALTRNVSGFLQWVYLDESEPDWTCSDR